MNNIELKAQLKALLNHHHGRSKAITSRELSRITGQQDRSIRLVIRELIAQGLPVVSTTEAPAGYFLVANWDEAREYEQSLKSRLIENALRRRDFKKSAALYLKPASQGKLI